MTFSRQRVILEMLKGGAVMVVPKSVAEAFDRGEVTVDDIRVMLEVEAESQGWSLEEALAWAGADEPYRNVIQLHIRVLASLLQHCRAA
jgi:hypothetical protein